MEATLLLAVNADLTRELIKTVLLAQEVARHDVVIANGHPTMMLLAPTETQPGSMHYMYLPPGTYQKLHWHPSERVLLLLGDCPVVVRHNNVGTDEDPEQGCKERILAPYFVWAVRIDPRSWHCFVVNETEGKAARGIVAISFHGTDTIKLEDVTPGLMEKLTNYAGDKPKNK